MKYSLTQLLLEDIAPRNFSSVAGDPSEEGTKNIGFLDVYNVLAYGANKSKEAFASRVMEFVYTRIDSDAKRIINKARATAKVRGAEIILILNDQTLADQIARDMGSSSTLSDDEKKDLAYCLRYYEDPRASPLKLKVEPSPEQSASDFEEEIRQGVREIKIAAAIQGIENWERQIHASNAALGRVMARPANQEALNAAQKLLGSDKPFQIDLADDPEIAPMLDAAENAKYQVEDGLGEIRHMIFTKPRLVVTPDAATRTVSYKPCGPRPRSLRESTDISSIRQLVELAMSTDPDESLDQVETAGTKVKDLNDALDQLRSRQSQIAAIIDKLYIKPGITAADIIASFSEQKWMKRSLNKLTYQFPNKGTLGSATQLTTQGSVPLARLASGVIPKFAAGYRTSQVPINALDLIAAALNVDDKNVKFPLQLLRAIEKQDRLFENSKDARLALLYAIGAAIEYSIARTGDSLDSSGRVTFGSGGFEDFKNNAYQSVLGYHHARTLAGMPGIQVLPGEKPDDYGVISRIMRRVKGVPDSQKITTMGFDPYDPDELSSTEDLVTLPPGEEGASLALNRSIADKTINILLKSLRSEIPGKLKKAATIFGNPAFRDMFPGEVSGRGASLNMIDFCNAVAKIAENNKVATQGLKLLGYESDAILMNSSVSGEDVWVRLCKLSAMSPYGNGSPGVNKFSASDAFDSWKSVMLGEPKTRAMSGIRSLFMSDFISPLARVILHAIDGYENMGLFSSGPVGEAETLRERLNAVYDSAQEAIRGLSVSAPPSETGIKYVRGGGSKLASKLVKTVAASAELGAIGSQYRSLNQNNPLKAPGEMGITLIAAEDAPRVVKISTLSIDSTQPKSENPADPKNDSPVDEPTQEPSTAQQPVPAQQPPQPVKNVSKSYNANGDVVIPVNEDASISVKVKLTARLTRGEDYSLEIDADIAGGTAQNAAKKQGLEDVSLVNVKSPNGWNLTDGTLQDLAKQFEAALKSDKNDEIQHGTITDISVHVSKTNFTPGSAEALDAEHTSNDDDEEQEEETP